LVFDRRRHLSPASHPGLKDRTITIQTFSKTFGLRDHRVGYVVAPNPQVGRAIRAAVEWSVLSVSFVSQRAAVAALEGPQDRDRRITTEVQANRDVMETGLSQARGINWVHPTAGPYLYVDVSKLGPADEVSSRLLLDHGVATLGGPAFKEAKHIRVPFGGPTERIAEAAERLATAVAAMADRHALAGAA
jgi:aspartate/methionine/tyrosine aminotransferase